MKIRSKLQVLHNDDLAYPKKTVKFSQYLPALMLSLAFMTLSNHASATTFYKWKSPEGVTHFSQTPPYAGSNVETIVIRNDGRMGKRGTTDTPDADSANTAGNASTNGADGEGAEQPADREAELQQQLADKEKQIRDANCTALKNNLASLNAGGRVYEMNDKGEKQFLDNRQIELKQQEVRSQIAKTCK